MRRFRFVGKKTGYHKLDREVRVIWNGMNPSLIDVQTLDMVKEIGEGNMKVDNDRFIKIKTKENKLELLRAAKDGKLRAVADASYNRELSSEVAAAAWVMETKDGKSPQDELGDGASPPQARPRKGKSGPIRRMARTD